MLTLRKVTGHPQANNAYEVFLGRLRVGSIGLHVLAHQEQRWLWSFSSHNRVDAKAQGDAATRAVAMIAFRAAWDQIITPADISDMQRRADFTAWKYAIWDIGGRFKSASTDPQYRFRKCPCGATLDCWDQAAVLPHVGHIEGAKKKPRHP